MTREELEEKATESFNNKLQNDTCYCTYSEETIYKDGYIAGAKELQEENKQLKTQIEKMKNCANCKFGYLGEGDMFENCRNCTMMYCICQKTKKEMNWDEKCDSWELAE